MLVVKDKVIDTPIYDLVKSLKTELLFRHIPKLSTMVKRGENLQIPCPIHKNGQELKPSCDILLEDKGNIPAGFTNCFACGYKAGFVKFVSDCLNVSKEEAEDWILSNSVYSLKPRERDILTLDENELLGGPKPEINVTNMDIDLSKFEYIHPYMFKRKLTDEVIKKFQVGYDPETDCLTFPVFQKGKLIFLVKRHTKYKRFEMPNINPKPIYGLDYLTGDEVIVCESIINALTCWAYGYQAIALLGTGSEYQIEEIKELPQRRIILALDGDNAGYKGTKKLYEALKNTKMVSVLKIPEGKDVNDLSKEEFNALYKELL